MIYGQSFTACLILIVSLFPDFLSAGDNLLIADFSAPFKETNIITEYDSFIKNPNDEGQYCNIQLFYLKENGKENQVLKIFYDVESSETAFGGIFFHLNFLDLSNYRKLTFRIKGDKEEGFTTRLNVEFVGKTGSEKIPLPKIKDKWKKVSIPLKNFKKKNLKESQRLVFVLEDNFVTKRKGVIYLDDIILE